MLTLNMFLVVILGNIQSIHVDFERGYVGLKTKKGA